MAPLQMFEQIRITKVYYNTCNCTVGRITITRSKGVLLYQHNLKGKYQTKNLLSGRCEVYAEMGLDACRFFIASTRLIPGM